MCWGDCHNNLHSQLSTSMQGDSHFLSPLSHFKMLEISHSVSPRVLMLPWEFHHNCSSGLQIEPWGTCFLISGLVIVEARISKLTKTLACIEFALLRMSITAAFDVTSCFAIGLTRVESFTLIICSAVAIFMVMAKIFLSRPIILRLFNLRLVKSFELQSWYVVYVISISISFLYIFFLTCRWRTCVGTPLAGPRTGLQWSSCLCQWRLALRRHSGRTGCSPYCQMGLYWWAKTKQYTGHSSKIRWILTSHFLTLKSGFLQQTWSLPASEHFLSERSRVPDTTPHCCWLPRVREVLTSIRPWH